MGLFGKLLEKKECSICGSEIGLFGNRKLENGNLCKKCAAELSPWFSDRRTSTVEEIRQQLQYREENKEHVREFKVSRKIGEDTVVYLDEAARKFLVTRASDYVAVNPDVIDGSRITGVEWIVEEDKDEITRKDKDGKAVSYEPKRYNYEYTFRLNIYVDHPYFNEISFAVNPDPIILEFGAPGGATMLHPVPNVYDSSEYNRYERLAKEMQDALLSLRNGPEAAETVSPAADVAPVKCPHCGAQGNPDANGNCEFCGLPMQ